METITYTFNVPNVRVYSLARETRKIVQSFEYKLDGPIEITFTLFSHTNMLQYFMGEIATILGEVQAICLAPTNQVHFVHSQGHSGIQVEITGTVHDHNKQQNTHVRLVDRWVRFLTRIGEQSPRAHMGTDLSE